MCGRFAQATAIAKIHDFIEIIENLDAKPRYNIAPASPVPAIRQREDGSNHWGLFHWGLIPHWAKEPDSRYKMINARAETLAEKPAFKGPFKYRRCIIPVDGYYEWKRQGTQKTPFYFFRKDQPLMLAGLWDYWEKDNHHIESLCIVTTAASDTVAPIHDRMPVILDAEQAALWLDHEQQQVKHLQPLLTPSDDILFYPVDSRVNNARIDTPDCIAPLQ